jgi:hypothetical protein
MPVIFFVHIGYEPLIGVKFFINYYIAGLKLESGESRMSVILHT